MKLPFDDYGFETWTDQDEIGIADESKRRTRDFYDSKGWIDLRNKVLELYGRECMKCGKTRGCMQVDHIRPRSRFPELSLVFENLQVLCASCNYKKDTDIVDYRINKSHKIR